MKPQVILFARFLTIKEAEIKKGQTKKAEILNKSLNSKVMVLSPSPCTSEVHSVKLSRSNCMISVESL